MRNSRSNRRCGEALGLAALLLFAAVASAAEPRGFKTYETRYYVIHTDLDIDMVREAAARLTAMAEEYHERTKNFAGTIRARMSFYLFSSPVDYYARGGLPGSGGMYNPNSRMLMAVLSKEAGDSAWRVVQHEGFHQFVHLVIRGRIPIWVNEGMAEYFSEGLWTGDSFVTGAIPPGRLQRVKKMIQDGKLLPFPQMLTMSAESWNVLISGTCYDQAWSMVHFLVHGDEGRYRAAFEGFIVDVSRGTPWTNAFAARFGPDTDAFEKRYKDWWLAQGDNPTEDKYVTAVVQTLTSFLARASIEGQKFATVEEFFGAAEKGELKSRQELWLPPSLLARALKQGKALHTWSLGDAAGGKSLILTRPDGQVFTGAYATRGRTIETVRVTITKPPPAQTQKAPASGKSS